MILDEAIAHARKVAKEKRAIMNNNAYSDVVRDNCKYCAKEHEQLADWLEELKAMREADRWISITEEDLPKENGFYLVTRLDRRGERIVDMAYYLKSAKEFECHNVSHWKPLPEPYKESEATNED